jgi:gas vesicle protein
MVLSLCAVPSAMLAAEKSSYERNSAEVKTMLNRLEEIKEMDKSSLKSSEKKELRKEVREIKSELKRSGQGVYFSVGAIIIIILLLILLL